MTKLKIKSGDTVRIIAGDHKGKEGKVLRVLREKNKAIVEGQNLVSKHTKPSAKNPQGGIVKKEAPIHISNLVLVDAKGVAYTNIDSYEYSKVEVLKKELKIKALQAAKAKATYLVEALGNQLGSVIDIQEINNESYPQPVYRTNMMMRAADAESAAPSAEIDFKKIKLSYVMNTVFEIK